MIGVYQILNTVSGNFYIGSSSHNLKVRKRRHFDDLRDGKHHNEPLQRAYNKYGKNSLVFHVLCATKEDQTIEVEQAYIDWMKPAYNTCKVARSVQGIKRSQEFCEAIKKRMTGNTFWKGRTMSEESKIKIGLANKGRSNPHKGIPLAIEVREKISIALKGGKRSMESRILMSDSQKSKKIVLDTETGVYFDSIVAAEKAYGYKKSYLNQVVNGKIKWNKKFILA